MENLLIAVGVGGAVTLLNGFNIADETICDAIEEQAEGVLSGDDC